jgi:hypothetical protein
MVKSEMVVLTEREKTDVDRLQPATGVMLDEKERELM